MTKWGMEETSHALKVTWEKMPCVIGYILDHLEPVLQKYCQEAPYTGLEYKLRYTDIASLPLNVDLELSFANNK